MAHLPSKEDVMGSEPQGPGHRSGNALLEGLMQVRTWQPTTHSSFSLESSAETEVTHSHVNS